MTAWFPRISRPVWLLIALLITASLVPGTAQTADLTDLFSQDGVLTATLVAAEARLRIGDLYLDGAAYNGLYAGPVLHVHPGDLMRIRLVNHLSQPTNLHFHGSRGSPLGNGDNAHLAIQPGGSFLYEVRIPPTQPVGLLWYHPHIHTIAEHQVMSGLSGTIIVEPTAAAPLAERLFVLKDMVFDDDTSIPEIDDTLHGIVQSVNGELLTRQAMRPNETQLWRFTNQSANRAVHIALDSHRLRIVAVDGEPTVAGRFVDVLDIPPASRLDALVEAGPPGQYALRARGIMTGTGAARTQDRIIGSLDVAGGPVTAVPPPPQPALPPDLRPVVPDATRTFVFTQTTPVHDEEQQFFINRQLFQADRIDVRVPLGNVEEWIIRNDSDDMHVFHIHQISFQVVAVNGTPAPFTGYVDNVLVPERGSLTLRLPFTDRLIVGRFMFHCHVLRHEDKGMMANIEIYDPTPPTLFARLNRLYLHVVWWWHGVPWSLCGLADA